MSGGTLERPELQRLLEDSRRGQFQVVLVVKMDRVARDLMAQLWLEKELLRSDVEIVSVAEPFRGQDATNRLFRQIIGAFAEFEKGRIADRMSGGRRAKASQGKYVGGARPWVTSHRGEWAGTSWIQRKRWWSSVPSKWRSKA